jgi:hypothetical protein
MLQNDELLTLDDHDDLALKEGSNLNDEESHDYRETPETILANGKKSRGSRYRGVSRNGNQWQVKENINSV